MSAIIVDVDDTLLLGARPNEPLIAALNASGDDVIVVSARPDSRTDETRKALRDAGLDFSQIHLSDFPPGPNSGIAFKAYKAEKLLADGYPVEEAIDNDADARAAYRALGLDVYSPSGYIDAQTRAIDPNGYEPTAAMREEAARGLAWRKEFGRGGTAIGVARARDISNGSRLPIDTVRRMASYFARHEVDKKGQGFSEGEDGYPSAGRIAWALWGGDAGMEWASRIIAQSADQSARAEREKMTLEIRQGVAELRAVGEDGMTFEGIAAVYDSPSAEGTNPEVVKPGAFSRSLAAAARGEWDIKAYADHNPERLLGTTKSGTLELTDTSEGLRARIKLNPEITYHRDLAAIVKTMGKSLGLSFGFFSTAANKVNDQGVRELRDVKLVEVSALTGLAPYYPATIATVAVRSLAEKAGIDVEMLGQALAALAAGTATSEQARLITTAAASIIAEDAIDSEEDRTESEEVIAATEEVVAAIEPTSDVPAAASVPRSIREKQMDLARRAVK